jgi:hypothetical protein
MLLTWRLFANSWSCGPFRRGGEVQVKVVLLGVADELPVVGDTSVLLLQLAVDGSRGRITLVVLNCRNESHGGKQSWKTVVSLCTIASCQH